jgi:hypothetical protein
MSCNKFRPVVLVSIAVALLAASFVAAPEKTRASPSPQDNQRIKFDTDQKEGIVRIIIDGKEIARMDATGFYVHGDIAYSGSITDGLPLRVTEGGDAK